MSWLGLARRLWGRGEGGTQTHTDTEQLLHVYRSPFRGVKMFWGHVTAQCIHTKCHGTAHFKIMQLLCNLKKATYEGTCDQPITLRSWNLLFSSRARLPVTHSESYGTHLLSEKRERLEKWGAEIKPGPFQNTF